METSPRVAVQGTGYTVDRSRKPVYPKAIQDKLDRLDEAFLFERSIDIETYDRHAEKLREELTLARMDRHSGQLDEFDVEGILAFAAEPRVPISMSPNRNRHLLNFSGTAAAGK